MDNGDTGYARSLQHLWFRREGGHTESLDAQCAPASPWPQSHDGAWSSPETEQGHMATVGASRYICVCFRECWNNPCSFEIHMRPALSRSGS